MLLNSIRRFSESVSRAPKESAHVRSLIKSQSAQKFKPIMLVSEYGELLNLKPMTKLQSTAERQQSDLRQVIMIDDNTDSKTLIKKMNHNPKAFFLYKPTGHY